MNDRNFHLFTSLPRVQSLMASELRASHAFAVRFHCVAAKRGGVKIGLASRRCQT
jgi:hypothetical protein